MAHSLRQNGHPKSELVHLYLRVLALLKSLGIRRAPGLVAVVATAALLIGCSGGLGEAELAEANERWNESAPLSYRYTISLQSNWGGHRIYRIEVNDGALTVLEPRDRHSDIDPERMLSMNGLLELAEQQWLDHEHSEVTFNKDFGFVETVESDDPEVDDDSLVIRVTAFEEISS